MILLEDVTSKRPTRKMAAQTPKKKWQFFGQTIPKLSALTPAPTLSDSSSSSSSSPQPPSAETNSLGESQRHPSPFQILSLNSPTHVPIEYASTAPIFAPTPVHPQDYAHHSALAAIGTHYPSVSLPQPAPPAYGRGPYIPHRFMAPVPDPPTYVLPSEDGPSGDGSSGEGLAPSYGFIGDDGGSERGGEGDVSPSFSQGGGSTVGGSGASGRCQKRPQRCRMCANHGFVVDMKGHKWYCAYRDCPCDDCEITRNTQYYMKERQKLTRRQQQQQQHQQQHHLNDDRETPEEVTTGAMGLLGRGSPGGIEPPCRRRGSKVMGSDFEQNQMDFPRVDEMVSQTQNILDYDLFEKVNQACRPRTSSHLPN